MEELLWRLIPWGYEVLLQIEQWRTPLVETVFKTITHLGDELFLIAFLPVLFWCVGRRAGIGTAYAYLVSTYLNGALKHYFDIPRPDSPLLEGELQDAGITARLSPVVEETSPSWPSNHSQGAIVSWGYLAYVLKSSGFWVVAVVLTLLIAFSRMVMGVHFPQDIIGGLALGGLYMVAWFPLEGQAARYLAGAGTWTTIGLSIVIPVLAVLLAPSSTAAMSMGAITGISIGLVVDRIYLNYHPGGIWWKRVLRAPVGLAVVFGLYLGLSALFGLFDEAFGLTVELALRMLRYGLVAFGGIYLAPWLLCRLGLADRQKGTGVGSE